MDAFFYHDQAVIQLESFIEQLTIAKEQLSRSEYKTARKTVTSAYQQYASEGLQFMKLANANKVVRPPADTPPTPVEAELG